MIDATRKLKEEKSQIIAPNMQLLVANRAIKFSKKQVHLVLLLLLLARLVIVFLATSKFWGSLKQT